MSEEQQAKLVDLACRLQNEENLVVNNGHTGRKNPSLYFTSGILAGWGLVMILFLILSAT